MAELLHFDDEILAENQSRLHFEQDGLRLALLCRAGIVPILPQFDKSVEQKMLFVADGALAQGEDKGGKTAGCDDGSLSPSSASMRSHMPSTMAAAP